VLKQAPRHEGVWEGEGIAARILKVGARWRWVVSFTPGSHSYRRLGGPQSQSGHDGKDKNS